MPVLKFAKLKGTGQIKEGVFEGPSLPRAECDVDPWSIDL